MPKGAHSAHRRGNSHHRWNSGRMMSSHGYVLVRVGRGHPLANANGYAYEHLLAWVNAGNPRPGVNEVLHHINEDKTDNRVENLALLSRLAHSEEHHSMVPDATVLAIRERYAAGEAGTDLAVAFGLPVSRVYRFIKGESRASVGGPMFPGKLRGKAAAGRLLDGREWSEVPDAR